MKWWLGGLPPALARPRRHIPTVEVTLYILLLLFPSLLQSGLTDSLVEAMLWAIKRLVVSIPGVKQFLAEQVAEISKN